MKNILCLGDSNTWGYNPLTKERFSKEIRWTGRLQAMLGDRNYRIMKRGYVEEPPFMKMQADRKEKELTPF